jgi:putative hydrolase of the HAD superfamily
MPDSVWPSRQGAGELRTRAAKPPGAVLLEAVLLDSFGTLVAMEPPGPLLAEALGVSRERADAAFRAEISYYLEHHGEGRDEQSLDDLRDRCAGVLRDSLGDASLALADVRAAMLGSIRFSAFPDAAPALEELRGRGLKLVVASNWDCSLPQVLDEAGLLPLVDGVVASAVAGADKPHAAVFEAALELAGCDASRAVHVGDSAEKDVAGARAAGIRALLIDRDGGRGDIESLAELPRIL